MLLSYLVRIIAVLAALWIAMRFLGTFLGKQTRRVKPNPSDRASSKKMVKDPVCGMYLDPHLAVKLSGKEGELYFCTEECRRKYLDGPASPPGPEP